MAYKQTSYRIVIAIYTLVILALFSPYIFNGNVIAPSRQLPELGVTDASASLHIENRKFNDFVNGYIPEINAHLHCKRSGWLTLWSNENEIGRPSYHISGFSPAYLPSYFIVKLTKTPWEYITLLSLSICYFSGFFLILFSREIKLHPVAGLVAGVSLATAPQLMYWLTFPMFGAVFCWSAGALWGITRLASKGDVLSWSVLSFSVYSLLMTAYPQTVVFHAYVISLYGVYLTFKLRVSKQATFNFLVKSLSAAIVGVIATLPVYLDLLQIASESGRVSPNASFFTAVLPQFSDVFEVMRFVVLSFVPEFFGNPIKPEYVYIYNGLSFPIFTLFFSIVGLCLTWRKTWGWWLAIVVLLLFHFIHPLYEFGVRNLGFNLSRSQPAGSILLPLMLIVLFGVDAFLKCDFDKIKSKVVIVSATVCLLIVGLALFISNHASIQLDLQSVMVAVVLIGLLIWQCRKTNVPLLIATLFLSVTFFAYPLMLYQAPEAIATNSPLVDEVKHNLKSGERFVNVSSDLNLLAPNLNASLGVASLHSYNSLSSTRYHRLIKELGGDVATYGRLNTYVSPDYAGPYFWMSNVGVVLSKEIIQDDHLSHVDSIAGANIYKVKATMGESLLVETNQVAVGNALNLGDPRLLVHYQPKKVIDEGDVLAFQMQAKNMSVFVLSQKYHPDWQANVLTKSGWQPASTVEVNGVFQGVYIPSGAERVQLTFKPFARYSWLSNLFWLLMFSVVILKWWRHAR